MFSSCSTGEDPEKALHQPVSKKAIKPATALVYNIHHLDCAVDGAIFLDMITAVIGSAKPEIRKTNELVSTNLIRFDQESQILSGEKKLKPWQKNETGYDFLIIRNVYEKEHSKYSLNEALAITIRETWEIRRVSDPAVARSWSVVYMIQGTITYADEEKKRIAAEKEVELIMSPARKPITDAIYSVIDANRPDEAAAPRSAPPQTAASENRAPIIDAEFQSSTEARFDSSYTNVTAATTSLDVRATDPDGDPLTYQWGGASGELKGKGGKLRWKRAIQDGAIAEDKVQLTVTDGRGGKAVREFIFPRVKND
jgi:hypothetical protein